MGDDELEYGLVMPFVTVASKGGPHDDESFVAGYRMGRLDAALAVGGGWTDDEEFITEACIPQVDLLAMRHGWLVEFSEPVDGWVTARFTRPEPLG